MNEARARAAWVGALLAVAALWSGRGAPPPCDAPVGAAAHGASTVEVRCAEPGAPLAGPARLLFGQALDANRAPVEVLQVLPGIGPARARALVDARRRAPFCRAVDLERARGVGPVLRERVTPWLSFADASCQGEAGAPEG